MLDEPESPSNGRKSKTDQVLQILLSFSCLFLTPKISRPFCVHVCIHICEIYVYISSLKSKSLTFFKLPRRRVCCFPCLILNTWYHILSYVIRYQYYIMITLNTAHALSCWKGLLLLILEWEQHAVLGGDIILYYRKWGKF